MPVEFEISIAFLHFLLSLSLSVQTAIVSPNITFAKICDSPVYLIDFMPLENKFSTDISGSLFQASGELVEGIHELHA